MNKQLVECVPNFSEGRDMSIIKQITDAIETVEGVKVLYVDPGKATNRTVVTFVGEVKAVVEAAFRAVVKAGEVIDMRYQHGEHPRMGATDVCPLIPISGITMDEVAEYTRALAERLATEAGIPTYCYEYAALRPERKKLAVCRRGEYEGLQQRFGVEDKMPDFGGDVWTSKAEMTGCTAVGARDFLIAINYNLNTKSTQIANAIAFDVRERGRLVKNELGEDVRMAGTLKNCAAIGWYIEEYGIAQVSMNITNIQTTPIHVAYEEVVRCAEARGVSVSGVEIIGLVPKSTLIDAGKYFMDKQRGTDSASDGELIQVAIRNMGLDDLCPFYPNERVIEYLMESNS